MKLYEISSEIRRILDQAVDPDTGELLPEVEQQLNALQMAFSDKVDCILCMANECGLASAAAETLEARYAKIAATQATNSERLLDYVKSEMERVGVKKLEMTAHLWRPRIQTNSTPTVKVTAPVETLEPEFKTVVPESIEPNKLAAIKHWRETGETPAGFEIRQGTHLRIV